MEIAILTGLFNNKKIKFFVIFVLVQALILFFSLFFTNETIRLYYLVELPEDILGDFRNLFGLLYYFKNPYNTGNIAIDVSYPPFALLFYMPYMLFFNFSYVSQNSPVILATMFFLGIPVLLILLLLIKNIKKNRALLIICLFLVFPFVFLLHRANVLIYSFMFVLFFITYYKSTNAKKKELSLLALAAASAIKFYPLVFLVILLKEGRIKDIIKVLLYFIFMFFIPFLFFEGGFDNISLFIKNMTYFTDSVLDLSSIKLDNYSFISIIQFIILIFNGKIVAENILTINTIISILFLGSVFVFSLILKSDWKIYSLLAMSITFVPVISFVYTQVFFLLAFIGFIKDNNNTKKEYIYMFLFLMILMPVNRLVFNYNFPLLDIPINFPWFFNNPNSPFSNWTPIESPLNTFIALMSMVLLYIFILIDAVICFVKSIRKNGFLSTFKGLIKWKKGIDLKK